jgi:hypothetical protein
MSPIAGGSQTITYQRGVTTTASVLSNGGVRVTPRTITPSGTSLPADRLVIAVAALNTSTGATTLGAENITATTPRGAPVHVWGQAELVHNARRHAAVQTAAIVLAAGAAAAAAAQPTTYNTNGTVWTPRGMGAFNYSTTVYDPARAAAASAAAGAAAGYGIAQVNSALNQTIANIGSANLLTTTLQPGEAFGGLIFVDKPQFAEGEPHELTIDVQFAGQQHEFKFAVGTDAPMTIPTPAPAAAAAPAATPALTRASAPAPAAPAPIAAVSQPAASADAQAPTAMSALQRPRADAVAYCSDGSFSYTHDNSAACRGHGGLQEWR